MRVDLELVLDYGSDSKYFLFFYLEIYQDEVFLFLKNYFWHQHIKQFEKIKNFHLKQKSNFKIFENAVCTAFPNTFLVVLSE